MKRKIKVEGQELVKEPGKVSKKVKAGTHASGNDKVMDVPVGTVVYSNKLKGPDGNSMAKRQEAREKRAKARKKFFDKFEKSQEKYGKFDKPTQNALSRKLDKHLQEALADEIENVEDIIQMDVANAESEGKPIPEYNLGGIVGLAGSLLTGNIPGAIMSGMNLVNSAVKKNSSSAVDSAPARGGFDLESMLSMLGTVGGGTAIPSFEPGGVVGGEEDWLTRVLRGALRGEGGPEAETMLGRYVADRLGQLPNEPGVPPANQPFSAALMTGNVPALNKPASIASIAPNPQSDPLGDDYGDGLDNFLANRPDFIEGIPDSAGVSPEDRAAYEAARDAHDKMLLEQRDKKNPPSTGDAITGEDGTMIQGWSPLVATLLNRITDAPRENRYKEYGERELGINSQIQEQAARNKALALEDLEVSKAGQRRRGRLSAGSVNLMRALDNAVETSGYRAAQKINQDYMNMTDKLLGDRGRLMTAQDQVRMGEEVRLEDARAQDKDAFWTAMGTAGQQLGRGYQERQKMRNLDPSSPVSIAASINALLRGLSSIG
jgi:hypothetical protein